VNLPNFILRKQHEKRTKIDERKSQETRLNGWDVEDAMT
jgi:hypothetical protein